MRFLLKMAAGITVLAGLAVLVNSAINWIYYETTGKYVTFDDE